jgi:hypothetical protein
MQKEDASLTPAADYLKSDEIGLVIAKGMAVLYKTNPKNPVDFLAKWLLNHAQVQKAAKAQVELDAQVNLHRKQHANKVKQDEEKANQKKAEEERKGRRIHEFAETLRQSHDLNDNLHGLVDMLKEATSATAVYIGKLARPFKPVNDGSTEDDHLNPDADPLIRFVHANKEHSFLVDKTLRADQGLTFEVFKNLEEVKEEEAPVEEVEEGSEEKPKVQKEPEEILPRSIYVKEVVREPKMHFFRVPRLGSYLAVRLEYQSCLSEEAFDAGLADYLSLRQREAARQEEIQTWNDAQEEAREQAEANGEEFKGEEKVFEPILPQPFKTETVSFVVCMNTMG